MAPFFYVQMERTINSLMYKGSIPDEINQSRREKKLFVVYISGDLSSLPSYDLHLLKNIYANSMV